MSIVSAIHAEWSNEVKEKWTKNIRDILISKDTSDSKKIQLISDAVTEMEEYEFSE